MKVQISVKKISRYSVLMFTGIVPLIMAFIGIFYYKEKRHT
jgi:hypothetical protein